MRELMFSEICDINNEFDVMMLGVFSARNDLYTMVSFIENNKDKRKELSFIFRYHIVMVKEAASFLHNVVLKEKNWKQIQKFPNFPEISVLKEEYKKYGDFNKDVLNDFRNNVVHYSDQKAYKSFFHNKEYEDFPTRIIIGKTKKDVDFEFMDYLDFNIFSSDYCKKHNLENNEDTMADLLAKTTTFALLIADLLDLVSVGFVNKKLNNKG